MLGSLRGSSKGAVLVEFSLSALLFFFVLMTTVEWSVEMYVRHSAERSLAAALRVYSTTGDEDLAEQTARSETAYILNRCLEPLDFRIFDSILGVDVAAPNAGHAPTGTPADQNAVFARITLTCKWQRFTPLMAGALGPTMTHSIAGLTKMR